MRLAYQIWEDHHEEEMIHVLGVSKQVPSLAKELCAALKLHSYPRQSFLGLLPLINPTLYQVRLLFMQLVRFRAPIGSMCG